MDDQNTNTNQGQEGQKIPISPTIPSPGQELSTATSPTPLEESVSEPVSAFVPEPITANEPQPYSEPVKSDLVFEPAKEAAPVAAKKPRINLSDFFKKNQKVVNMILLIIVGLIVIASAIFVYLTVFKKASVLIQVDQSPIDITVGEQTYPNVNSPYNLKLVKGTYEIKVSKNGFLSSTQTVTITSSTAKYPATFSLKPQPTPVRIIDKEALFPALNPTSNTILYFEKGEAGYNIKEFNLTDKTTSSVVEGIEQVTKVTWSPSFRQAAVKVINSPDNKSTVLPYLTKYPEGSRVNWIVNTERRDLVNIQARELTPFIKNICFNSEGNRIYYFYQNNDDRYLTFANLDGSNFEPIAQIQSVTFEADVVLSHNNQKIAYFANTENGTASKAKDANVFVYDTVARQKVDVSDDGVSTGALFAPDDSRIIYESSGKIHISNLNETDADKIDVDTGISGSVANCAWLDSNNFVAYNASEGIVIRANINGTKSDIGYSKESIPANIKNVFVNNGKVYLFSPSGVYALDLGSGI